MLVNRYWHRSCYGIERDMSPTIKILGKDNNGKIIMESGFRRSISTSGKVEWPPKIVVIKDVKWSEENFNPVIREQVKVEEVLGKK